MYEFTCEFSAMNNIVMAEFLEMNLHIKSWFMMVEFINLKLFLIQLINDFFQGRKMFYSSNIIITPPLQSAHSKP